MAITISGENNNDRILASDGVIDSLSGFNVVGVITATSFTGDLTGDVTGNLTGNVTGNINNSTLLLQTGGTERVRITSAGKIGINETSPDWALHVTEGSENARIKIERTGTYGVAGVIFKNTIQEHHIQTNSGNFDLYDATAYATRLRINSDGRFLLNHGSSRAVANVIAQVQLEGTTANTSAISIVRNSASEYPPYLNFGKSRATSTGGTTIINNNDSLGEIRFSGADGTDLTNHAASINAEVDGTPGSNVTPGRLIFSTTSATGSDATEKLRITSAGKVGIGSDSPSETLDIHTGTHGFDPYIKFGKDGNYNPRVQFFRTTGGSPSHYAAELRLYTGDFIYSNSGAANLGSESYVERLRIDSTGRLGIGVDSFHDSSTRLQLQSPGSDHTGIVITAAATSTLSYIYFGDTADKDIGRLVYENSSDSMQFWTNNAERLRINSSGHLIPGSNNTQDLGSTAKGWRNIFTNDLNLSNMNGEKNDIDGTQGSWTIQEGKDNLYIINRLNGKKFKIKMEEIS